MWKKHKRKVLSEMRPYVDHEVMYYTVIKVGVYRVSEKGVVIRNFHFALCGDGEIRDPYIHIGTKQDRKAVINITTQRSY